MMFDDGAYMDAYLRIKFEGSIEQIDSDIKVVSFYNVTEVYDSLKNFYKNNDNNKKIVVDGRMFERVYDRIKVLTQIADFLADYEEAEVTYVINVNDIEEADKLMHRIAENKDKLMSMIRDVCTDDYIVLIEFEEKNLDYIKVYPDGTCKRRSYRDWNGGSYSENTRVLDKKLFDKLLAYANKKVKARKKQDSILCGEYPIKESRPYYTFGYSVFGQLKADYGYEEVTYFDYKTGVKVLDSLIKTVAPDISEPLMGLPALPIKFRTRTLGDYDPDEYEEDDDELLGDPLPDFYDEEDDVLVMGKLMPDFDEDEEDLDSLFTKRPSEEGKDKCEQLREIRMKFAKDNDIDYEFKECTHEGPCAGTCPLCDKEAKDLAEIAKKRGIKFDNEE